jgi:hypothetical protein
MFGTLAAIGELALFGEFGEVGWWSSIIILAFAGGWVWSYFMWFVFAMRYGLNPTPMVEQRNAPHDA